MPRPLAPAPGSSSKTLPPNLSDALRELGVSALSDRIFGGTLAETQRGVASQLGSWGVAASIDDNAGGEASFVSNVSAGVDCLTSDDATAFRACASRALASAFTAGGDHPFLALENAGMLDLLSMRLSAVACLEAAADGRWANPAAPRNMDAATWHNAVDAEMNPLPRVAWLLARCACLKREEHFFFSIISQQVGS